MARGHQQRAALGLRQRRPPLWDHLRLFYVLVHSRLSFLCPRHPRRGQLAAALDLARTTVSVTFRPLLYRRRRLPAPIRPLPRVLHI